MEKPPDVVGNVPHVPRYLATIHTVGSGSVHENGDNMPYFELSPAEEEIIVEYIEQRLPGKPEVFDSKLLLGPC